MSTSSSDAKNSTQNQRKVAKRNFLKDVAKVHPITVVHPDNLSRRVLMSHQHRLGFILEIARSKGIKLNNPTVEQRLFVRRLSKEVFGGTQEPVITVRSPFNALTTAAGGNLATVVSYYWGGAIDQSNWAAVFDEVKVLTGYFEIWPESSFTARVVFVIDYDDSTALGSYTAALAYDTHIVYNPCGTIRPRDHCRLSVVPKGIPDKQWLDTGDTTTVSAYLKCWSTDAAMTTKRYDATFTMEVKFRQVD